MIARLLLLLRDAFTDYPRSGYHAWRTIWDSRHASDAPPLVNELEEQRSAQ